LSKRNNQRKSNIRRRSSIAKTRVKLLPTKNLTTERVETRTEAKAAEVANKIITVDTTKTDSTTVTVTKKVMEVMRSHLTEATAAEAAEDPEEATELTEVATMIVTSKKEAISKSQTMIESM
jgi:hypothetical protein